MPLAELFNTHEQGFEVVGLRTPQAELSMVPSLGGRVISLRNRLTGREWCWHQPRSDWLWANAPGDDFGKSPQAGIDECVPTVSACDHKGRRLPDHGEVWFQSWTLDPVQLGEQRLQATLRLPTSPFVFTRTIRASESGFEFDYSLTNLGGETEAYLWSLHPLFTILPGDRLVLPDEVRSLRLDGGLGTVPISRGDRWAYPEAFPEVRLDRLEVPGMPKGCVKGFAGPLTTGRAALVNDSTGDRLEIIWDPRSNPLLGLWLNRGHAGFHHVALEPTNGAPDSLALAVQEWRQHGNLSAGATAAWTISLKIS